MQKMSNRILSLWLLLVFTASCTNQLYHKKVTANITDFTEAIHVLKKERLLEPDDSIILKNVGAIKLNNKCVHDDAVREPSIILFMKKYDLSRICFARYADQLLDSAIMFHKKYNPFFGKAIV